MTKRIRSAVYGSPFYRMSLVGRTPNKLQFVPEDLWSSQAARADELFHGRYIFAGEEIRSPGRPPWIPDGCSEDWIASLHSFEWLRALKNHGGVVAQRLARALVTDWMDVCGSWRPLAWRPDVLGQRVAALILHAPFLTSDPSDEFTTAFYQSLTAQTRHLTRVVDQEVGGSRRIAAIRGLVYATLCLSAPARNISNVLALLDRELRSQILPDGGHIERSPKQQCRVLGDLGDVNGLLNAADVMVPQRLVESLDKMAPMLRCLRHGDGGLACFNGSSEGNADVIDNVLKVSQTDGNPLYNAPFTGFQRVTANKTTAIMDTGSTTAPEGNIYAGALSLEMSVGKERLVVNCGPYRGGDNDWRLALCGSAAHSTVTIDNRDSIDQNSGLTSLADVNREEQSGAVWIDALHKGYESILGLRHRRRLYMDSGGEGVRGEDQIELVREVSTDGLQSRALVARFHLHPSVRASLIRNNDAVLLRLPSGVGWQFHAKGGEISLNESIYFGDGGVRRRTEQILVSSSMTTGVRVLKWAFQRIAAPT